MLRPITKAPAETIASTSVLFSSGVSNIQACSRSTAPSPKGFSRLWSGPATYPSAEIEMSHTTLAPMGSSPPAGTDQLQSAIGTWDATAVRLQNASGLDDVFRRTRDG